MPWQTIESSHLIGKKWFMPVFEEIALNRFEGFNSFVKKDGSITPKILSMELQELQKGGLIKRTSDKGSKKTSYVLTDKGREFHDVIKKMKKWNEKWNNTPECTNISCTDCKKNKS